MSQLWGKYPAIIKEYNKVTRLCRVQIPSIADNGDVYPEAEICYPLGDKSLIKKGTVSTEIELLVDDMVWVEFQRGDQNHPIVVGYRCPRVGNDVDWRRYHHANIQLISDEKLVFNAKNITINATENITINAGGEIKIYSDKLTHNDVSISDTHKHSGIQGGNSNTGNPI